MKKRMRRLMTIVLAMILILSMNLGVFAATITGQKAQSIALNNAGLKASRVTRLSVEMDDNMYEVKFTRKSDKIRYEYVITKAGKIKEIEITYPHTFTSSRKRIGSIAARKAVAKTARVPLADVKSGTIRYRIDDGEGIYKLTFRSGNCRYEVEQLAATGRVIEIDKKY